MKIAILGYGIEGKSACKFLKKKYPCAYFEIRDIKRQNEKYLNGLEKFNMIVRSPGIPYLTPKIQRAKKKGVEITSATKLFWTGTWTSDVQVIGITGTKGKGTVASMLYSILKAAKKNVFLVGNIGNSALDILPKLKNNSVVIFELSSFQLQDLERSPHIAVVLEIVQDHLDYHHSMKEYTDAKANIARYQKRGDTVFYIRENKYSRAIAQKSKGKKIVAKTTWGLHLQVLGEHNMRNAAVAASVSRMLGIDNATIKKALESFRGLPYHLEFVREINGVKFYNDSASTNPISTKAAIEAIAEPKILITGGVDKGFDYGILRAPIMRNGVRRILLFGANKNKIKRQLRGIGAPILCADIKSALKKALSLARAGDAILFSPASASFDMFKDSKDRGAVFLNLIKDIRK